MDRKACFCGAAFISLDVLYQHAVDQGHRFMCSCTRVFKTEQNVKDHQRDSGPGHPSPSITEHPALAGYETANSVQEAQHQVSHAAKRHPCHHCNKSKFKSFDALQSHLKDTHAICPTCKQTFPTKQDCSSHRKQLGHWYCREHDQEFSSIDELRAHNRAQTHVKDFTCMICTNREFGTQQGLDDHLRDVHPTGGLSQGSDAASEAARLRTKERNLYCLDCKQQFQSLTALYQHRASPKHKPLSELTCPLSAKCKRMFTTPSALLFHMESGGCKSGMNRLKLNAMVHQQDTGRHITYSKNKARVISDAASVASLMDGVGKLSVGSSRGPCISYDDSIPSDDIDVASQTSDSTLADTGGVILTPRSSAANSTSEWSFIHEDLATPSSTSAKSSSGQTITEYHPDSGVSCPTCNKSFKTRRRLLHLLNSPLNSPVHAAKIFHCPTDTGKQIHAKGEKKFKTLSGMAQHIEVGACAGGMATLDRIVGIFEEKVKQATGMELRLLKSSSA
ncbi:hypothetical protein KC343_g6167 [Hortaea werneckii]|nr:hypothetical protein KC352_g13107 [Hortaea werneckii]KAI7565431.1 hypothetical protein KC317_g6367 [Hortaea werneckii]KAI7616478.1 hypothetical protein KC346_g5979 [Hortaea werneckii]KAI7626914.1 hypothetical protein KC343_g6167 [Hortaea werneckii]KAI7669708.1 hypothetical protein KC319_g6064 [Hortaea werneckii]